MFNLIQKTLTMPKTKSIEDTYKKFTQLEHVLQRPGMYIGETKTITGLNWRINQEGNMEEETLTWNPGLYKLFDEILTNAADESQRNPNVKNIYVNISSTEISVYNDGKGIPIEIHKEHQIYVPELIFGNLLSSSNYDDSEKRTVGGTNGLGAKLTNIYSTKFTIETCCNGKKYTQTFSNNMQSKTEPKITSSTKEYTKITFNPDFKRFGISNIDQDNNLDILTKRVYDISAVTNKNVSIHLNSNKIKIKDFQEYINLYLGSKKEAPRVYEEFGSRWKVCIGLSKSGSFQQVSFVNGISTIDGGSHIDYILNFVSKQIAEELQNKYKNINIKSNYVKEHLFIFVWCLIDNPTFSSQTKDKHTTKVSEFGSRCSINDEFIKKVSKLGFIEQLLKIAETKDKKQLSKTDGKKTTKVVVPKLDDANKAGTYESDKCTLILTEGDSAKTTAISGLSVVGRDYYGVFPLKGKLLNTRTATYAQLSKNEEICNIKKIIGLQSGKIYKNLKELRYGKILVMTDQDVDGFHIKSLIVNFIHNNWPELLQNNVFIESLLTPIVKASYKKELVQFYNIPDYEKWKKDIDVSRWTIKYYKGLGTSDAKEAKEYFRNMKKLGYVVKNEEDNNSLVLAFDKTKTDERKKWIVDATKHCESIEYKSSVLPVQTLINQELVWFSIQDNIRSIPNLVDGLKPSQRKVLFACFKKNLTKEIKVAQLAGYVSEKTSYHHGETSLMQTIINMSQDFVGSNNMNLLVPKGQFGCVDPNTEILTWNGTIKLAKNINIDDVLVGDDGKPRNISKIVSGIDTMYKIKNGNMKDYIVNSQHILTLKYLPHKKIYWKSNNHRWTSIVYNNKTKSFKTISVSTKNSDHFNSSILTKEQAYQEICNKLKNYEDSNIFDINIQDYLILPQHIKKKIVGIVNSSLVEWEEQTVPIPPYILGSWLGDGYSDCHAMSGIDSEIYEEWMLYLETIDCELVHIKVPPNGKEICSCYIRMKQPEGFYDIPAVGDQKECYGCKTSKHKFNCCNSTFEKQPIKTKQIINKFKQLFKNNNLYKNKHIPDTYVKNSKQIRLELLAGFIDTDGSLGNNCYRLHQHINNEHIIEKLRIISGSLGFRSKVGRCGNMLELCIYGENISEIPVRVPRKQFNKKEISITHIYNKINVEKLEIGEYIGWYIDSNERFLLGDFTVTHNTRIAGGQDASSPRYIFTLLSKYTHQLFNPDDFDIIDYLEDDGISIEPKFFVPTLPLILINGSQGIGTGFSTNIPCFNPEDIKQALRLLAEDEDNDIDDLNPWYKNFKGKITKFDTNRWYCEGKYSLQDGNLVKITELPIGTWTEDYKQFLEKLEAEDKIAFFKNNCTEVSIDFEVKLKNDNSNEWQNNIEKFLKLITTLNASNMHVFDENGIIVKMNSPEEIVWRFFKIRNSYFIKRQKHLISKYSKELNVLESKFQFIKAIMEETLLVFRRKKNDILEDIKNFKSFKFFDNNDNYSYLLEMNVYHFTEEKLTQLEHTISQKKGELENIKSKKIIDFWNEVLN